ncbi:MAG: flagellar export protein FliJ [Acidobacteriota bacterium]|nr:flagellar export protein FliJ [Acidobacteriota bacterium]
MAFRFSFASLLRLRTLMERHRLSELEHSLARLHAMQHSVEEAEEWKQRSAEARNGSGTIPARELQFVSNVMAKTDEAIHLFQARIVEEEKRASEMRRNYLDARSQRKVVSTLRDNAARAYQVEMSRREQAAIDEMHLTRLRKSEHDDSAPAE